MEPVRWPQTISPIAQAERVKRAKRGEDSGGGSAFTRYLPRKKETPADPPDLLPEDPDETADPASPGDPEAGDAGPPKKLIDLRI